MSLDNSSLTLTVPSDLRLLPLVRGFVEAACESRGFDARVTHAVVLATSEAATNVIRHAHRGRPDAILRVECLLGPGGVEVCLRDEGAPFNLTTVPDLDPSEIRLGGRGVFLMRRLMDELSCSSLGESGNILRMVKRCGSEPGPTSRSA